jgi:hypothetical protein
MTVVFVSAIYPIYGSSFPERTANTWLRFATLAKHFHIHLVCSAADKDKVPPNVTPHFCEFIELETYKSLTETTGLPQIRSEIKDTKEFMILMNAKTEFIKMVSKKVEADHYVWLDAGIGHIFKDPDATYAAIKPFFDTPLRKDKIMLPGCTKTQESSLDILLTRVCWRFAGGFFIVPRALIDPFYQAVLAGCEEIRHKSGRATWEVNVWAYIESRIPIQWEYGNHNESIFNGICNYFVGDAGNSSSINT